MLSALNTTKHLHIITVSDMDKITNNPEGWWGAVEERVGLLLSSSSPIYF